MLLRSLGSPPGISREDFRQDKEDSQEGFAATLGLGTPAFL